MCGESRTQGSEVEVRRIIPPIDYNYTVENARKQMPSRTWIGVGVLPPHVQESEEKQYAYAAKLLEAGAKVVLNNIEELSVEAIANYSTF